MADACSTYEAFIAMARRWVQEHRLPDADPLVEIRPTTDLFETGILDSLAFVELVSFLEERTGCVPDLASLTSDVFATLAGLSTAFGFADSGPRAVNTATLC